MTSSFELCVSTGVHYDVLCVGPRGVCARKQCTGPLYGANGHGNAWARGLRRAAAARRDGREVDKVQLSRRVCRVVSRRTGTAARGDDGAASYVTSSFGLHISTGVQCHVLVAWARGVGVWQEVQTAMHGQQM